MKYFQPAVSEKYISWVGALTVNYNQLSCKAYWQKSTEDYRENTRTQDPKEDPITRDPKEDPAIEGPREKLITEDP